MSEVIHLDWKEKVCDIVADVKDTDFPYLIALQSEKRLLILEYTLLFIIININEYWLMYLNYLNLIHVLCCVVIPFVLMYSINLFKCMNIYVENDLFEKILINIVFISGKNIKITCIVFWFKNNQTIYCDNTVFIRYYVFCIRIHCCNRYYSCLNFEQMLLTITN